MLGKPAEGAEPPQHPILAAINARRLALTAFPGNGAMT